MVVSGGAEADHSTHQPFRRRRHSAFDSQGTKRVVFGCWSIAEVLRLNIGSDHVKKPRLMDSASSRLNSLL
jgi:hypothetical protein